MAKPTALATYIDDDLGDRLYKMYVVMTGVNSVLEYYYSGATHDISVPDLSSSANFMIAGGTLYLNNAINALNAVNTAASLGIPSLSTWVSIDYNDWLSDVNKVINYNNAIRTALP